ncbi:MAG: Lrp/AsnC family transcriptional regulator, leucine-responsive regulatory protein [Sphingomonadales bacterium]|jgi:DNA-binding Lrp family transcriptional regulator|nr:Lrp/AsnC family transcriptional regulator, leucine-responsive regulatory protein [Sphingomonadales bacterium]
MDKKLDQIDLRLLACLQADNQLTAELLAERVGLSPSAVARRLRQLRSARAIAADVAIVAEQALGHPLSAIIHIQLERHALTEVASFKRQLAACDNVQFCLEISGAFDILLLVVVAGMDSFNLFADDMLAGQRAVRRYETSFVKRRLKASLALPLDQLAG